MFSVWQLLKAANFLLRVQQIKQSFFGHLNLNLLVNTGKKKQNILCINYQLNIFISV